MKRGTAVAWVAIHLTQGKVALIDAEDLDRVTQHTWCAAWMHYDWRAVAWIDGKTVTLHRFVMNAGPGQQVDHKNGDGLDCRKSELRFATHRQNNQNTYRVKPGCFKGVRPSGKKYRSSIKANGRMIYLGTSDTAEEAARRYDAAALEHFGEFARLNFPEMPAAGLEPAAYRSGGGRSNPLSYAGTLQQSNPNGAANAETSKRENVPEVAA